MGAILNFVALDSYLGGGISIFWSLQESTDSSSMTDNAFNLATWDNLFIPGINPWKLHQGKYLLSGYRDQHFSDIEWSIGGSMVFLFTGAKVSSSNPTITHLVPSAATNLHHK